MSDPWLWLSHAIPPQSRRPGKSYTAGWRDTPSHHPQSESQCKLCHSSVPCSQMGPQRPVNGYVTDARHSLSFHAAWSWVGGSEKCIFLRLMMQHSTLFGVRQFLSGPHQLQAVWSQVNYLMSIPWFVKELPPGPYEGSTVQSVHLAE